MIDISLKKKKNVETLTNGWTKPSGTDSIVPVIIKKSLIAVWYFCHCIGIFKLFQVERKCAMFFIHMA